MFKKKNYTIKSINKDNLNDDNFNEALSIYERAISDNILTNRNEIKEILEKQFEQDAKKQHCIFWIECFILYENNVVIGFSMWTHLKNKKRYLLEYLALSEHKNSLKTQRIFLTKIIKKLNIRDNGYIVEVIGDLNDHETIKTKDLDIRKLSSKENLLKIDAPYYTLPIDEEETVSLAHIYIQPKKGFLKLTKRHGRMSKKDYIEISSNIYEYYISWYEVLPEPDEDKIGKLKILEENYKKLIKSSIDEKRKIDFYRQLSKNKKVYIVLRNWIMWVALIIVTIIFIPKLLDDNFQLLNSHRGSSSMIVTFLISMALSLKKEFIPDR